ncbi:NF-kappa-B inhibitor zeta-like [Myxocyprinus asiaticus]|uniref:NF-kappa-B inhibitor zeta-like n=1 Tax=Myxocyprinus asiaticus TaxID=70543 RepID=UPI002223754F|nr:NF-kappa-B inhibitor zeta-like [Myxocyprinus asiaticus]
MQKRHHDVQAQQYHIDVDCPDIIRVLQTTKRRAENISHTPVKRPTTDDTNILSPCSDGLFSESEMLEEIGDVLTKDRLSIDSVTVQGFVPVIQKYMQTSGRHVNTERVNYDGLTALHIAVLSHNAVVQELLCHVTPSSAHTVSLVQRRKELSDCINMLLLMGASLETKDQKSGRTALHIAAEEANVEPLRVFLNQSNYFSVINAKAFNGNMTLHMVSALQGRQTQVDAVRLLLQRGADLSTKNLENEQPAQLVSDGPLGEQVRQILKGRGGHSRS